jgi:hypothetical protein
MEIKAEASKVFVLLGTDPVRVKHLLKGLAEKVVAITELESKDSCAFRFPRSPSFPGRHTQRGFFNPEGCTAFNSFPHLLLIPASTGQWDRVEHRSRSNAGTGGHQTDLELEDVPRGCRGIVFDGLSCG